MLPIFLLIRIVHFPGGGKRKGAFAVYIEPWHADIEKVLELKRAGGKDETRARTLFYALWVPDLFMKRVEEGGDWSLFCPNTAKGLTSTWGEKFEELYLKYEREGKARKVVKAEDLWQKMLEVEIETGVPYMMFKDACNAKSNQQNLGTIKCSNLCTEVVQYSSKDEISTCTLASINLTKFVKDQIGLDANTPVDPSKKYFDLDHLVQISGEVAKNLNRVIDISFFSRDEMKKSSLSHRPIGIGVQGLADVFFKLRLPFDSPEAAKLNRDIFEAIYFGALCASNHLSMKDGPYSSFEGSPASKGILQFHMWGVKPSDRYQWDTLITNITNFGLRNSLLVAPMPTASTAQILGNTECFEPVTANIYSRRVLAGDFMLVNKYLQRDLEKLGLWSHQMKNHIVADRGSVQNIPAIPADLKALYKTAFEIKHRVLIDMAADRGAFIDQSQSLNCFNRNPTVEYLSTMHFHAWKRGLKTGMYYLRTSAATDPKQMTVDVTKAPTKAEATHVLNKIITTELTDLPPGVAGHVNAVIETPLVIEGPVCNRDDPNCLGCSS